MRLCSFFFFPLADEERAHLALVQELTTTQKGELVSCEELPFMDLDTIITATDNFSDSNKLGQGGFGSVYKVTPLISI